MTSTPETVPTVFVVDDESAVRDALRLSIRAMGFTSRTFSSGSQFLDFVASYEVNGDVCLIVDMQMPRMSGVELLQRLKAIQKQLPAILISGHGAQSLQQDIEGLGADLLAKPFRSDELQKKIVQSLAAKSSH